MQKSVLIAVRDATSCGQGVRFAGSFFKNHTDLTLTLFYVMHRSMAWEGLDDPWSKKNDDVTMLPPEIKKVFALCCKSLENKGFVEEQIKKVFRKKSRETMQDILQECKNGLHDAVIFGKKSTSFVEDFLCGNKGHEVLEKDLTAPVWFCRDPDESRENVLLCVDGSAVGERVADHVGFILQGETHHSVTLFYVDNGQGVMPEKVFAETAAVLKSFGLSESRIHRVTVKSMRVANAILKMAEQGNFAAIAIGSIGRTGPKGVYERIVGSKCKNIFNEIDKAALWIVP